MRPIGSVAVAYTTLTASLAAPGWAVDPVTHVPVGSAFPGYVRVLTGPVNIAGALCLVFGAIYSAYIYMPKRKVLRAMRSGMKPVWRLRTALGHEIVATAEHPVMTMAGWLELGKLKVGDHVATARSIPVRGRRRWPRRRLFQVACRSA